MAKTGHFLINLDTDKRIRIWIDDTSPPSDPAVYKFWLKPTNKILAVYNEESKAFDQVTNTVPIIASVTQPASMEVGGIWLDESTSPATLKKKTSSGFVSVPIGDIIIGNGGNATLTKASFDQTFNTTDIVQVLDIPNLLLTKKLVNGKISFQNLSTEVQAVIYFKIKTTGKVIDQVALNPQEYIAMEYSDTFPIIIDGSGNFRLIFEGYVLN